MAMPVIHDLHQIIPVRWFQWLQLPVIDHQQLHLGQDFEVGMIAAVRFGLSQFQQEVGEPVIADAQAPQSGTVPQGAGEVGFSINSFSPLRLMPRAR